MLALKDVFARHGKPLSFQPDETIISRGTRIARVFRVQSGQVLLHSASAGGREIAFDIVKPDEIFGFVAAVEGTKAIVDATALTRCELLVISRETFNDAIRSSPDAACEALSFVVRRLVRRTVQAQDLAVHSLRGRLARWVIGLARDQGCLIEKNVIIRLDFNQKLIAAMAGVSRETLNRQLKNWVDARMVEFAGKNLRILKPDALRTLAGHFED